MKDKKNIAFIVGGLLLLVGATIGLSYGFLSITKKQELANVFTSGCLNISIENESNSITLNNAYPITDIEGLEQVGYTFTIRNTCNTPTNYMINLESLNQTINTLDTQYIKTSLSSDTMDNLIQKLDSDMVTKAYINNAYVSHNLYLGLIEGKSTKEFTLKLWMDYDTTKEQGANKIYQSKINVIASPDIKIKSTLLAVEGNPTEASDFLGSDKTRADFESITTLDNINIPQTAIYNWDVSTTQDKSIMAWYTDADNNGKYELYIGQDGGVVANPLSNNIFRGFTNVTNIDLKNFNTSKVTKMNSMFYGNSSLTNLNLGDKFDTSNVTAMNTMFYGASSLTNLDLGNKFDTSNVTNMSSMFYGASSLTNLDLGNKFDTSNVTNMSSMFSGASGLTNLDLSNFNTSNVTNMSQMFYRVSSLINLDLGDKFDTSKVTNMRFMFSGASSLTNLDLGDKFNTSEVTFMSGMFYGASSLTSLDLGDKFNTSEVTDMSQMFYNVSNLTSLDLGNKFDTSKVTDMKYMFSGASSLTNLDLGDKFDTSKVTNMKYMFYNTSNLTSLDLGDKFNALEATDMNSMFFNASSLTSLDLSNFDTSKVTDMSQMFYNASSLTTLDFRKANFSKVTDYSHMFSSKNKFTSIIVKDAAAQEFINARLSDVNKTGVSVTIGSS